MSTNPLQFTDLRGRRHTAPSVTGIVEAETVEPIRGELVNDLIVLSPFRSGQPNVLRRHKDIAGVVNLHDPDRDGDQGVELCRIARAGFGDSDVFGAADLLTLRVGSATNSAYTLLASGSVPLLTLATADYGSHTKGARVTLGSGSVVGKKVTLKDSNPKRTYVGDNLGVLFALQYVGSSGSGVTCDILYSNGTLTYSGQPTDGDTVVVNGVTFEFDGNATVTGGNVAVTIGATADATFAALLAAMNGRLDGVTATLDAANDKVSLYAPEVGLEIQETSSAIAATTAPPAALLRTKVGSAVDLSITLPLQQFSSIDALAKFIDAQADYTCTVSPYADKFIPSTGLDAAAAVNIKASAVNFSGYCAAIARWVTERTQGRFTATEVARGEPVDVANGAFTGGSTPAAVAADWLAALDEVGAKQENGGIIVLDTDDPSTFVAAAAWAQDQMADAGKWFRVYYGAQPGLTRAEYERIAQGVDNPDCRMVIQRMGRFVAGGSIEYVPPVFFAAAIAGGASGNRPYKPLTNRRLRFAGIHETDVWTLADREALLEAGITVAHVEQNNVVLTLAVTTSRDPDRRMPRIASESDCLGLLGFTMRQRFLPYRGKWADRDLDAKARGTMTAVLQYFTDEGMLVQGTDEQGNTVPPWRVPSPAFVMEAGVMQLNYQVFLGSELNHVSQHGRAAYARIAGEIRGPQNVSTAIPL